MLDDLTEFSNDTDLIPSFNFVIVIDKRCEQRLRRIATTRNVIITIRRTVEILGRN